jgi:hypothetical protein
MLPDAGAAGSVQRAGALADALVWRGQKKGRIDGWWDMRLVE